MNPEKVIAFDIETGPLPYDQIKHLEPDHEPPKNYKNPETILNWKTEQREAWLNNAALKGHTGQLLAWGAVDSKNNYTYHWQDSMTGEQTLMKSFWEYFESKLKQGYSFAGSCVTSFDIPFLRRRTDCLNESIPAFDQIKIPSIIKWSRYGNQAGVFNLQDWWNTFPGENRDRVSLDTMAKFFGHKGKNGDGALFYKVFQNDVDTAIEYLMNDIDMTRLCVERLCPTDEPAIQNTPEFI